MAGIYIHIPFCKQKCHYCDFHFSINHNNIDKMIDAICTELISRANYIDNQAVETIYFGGGTPSVLNLIHLNQIINTIKSNFVLENSIEYTLECNPDDLDEQKLIVFKNAGINRLSIGIQSFDEKQLTFLNRAHNSSEAINSVKLAKKIGFDNITIDLIYGLPNTDIRYWENQIKTAIQLGVPHISSYCLTFENKTVFGNWQKKGKITALNDDKILIQFNSLINLLEQAGYEHYEISNFSKPNYISKHNSAYWLGKAYLGIGPSAHSFNGKTRQWNVSNNTIYIKNVKQNLPYFEQETLTKNDLFNEHILTRLRTKWGVDLNFLRNKFPNQFDIISPIIDQLIDQNKTKICNNIMTLTDGGKIIADGITSDLFVID